MHLRLRHLEFKLHKHEFARIMPACSTPFEDDLEQQLQATVNAECSVISTSAELSKVRVLLNSTRYHQIPAMSQHMLPQIPARSVGIHNLRH